jgi:hypothetical protein
MPNSGDVSLLKPLDPDEDFPPDGRSCRYSS